MEHRVQTMAQAASEQFGKWFRKTMTSGDVINDDA